MKILEQKVKIILRINNYFNPDGLRVKVGYMGFYNKIFLSMVLIKETESEQHDLKLGYTGFGIPQLCFSV